MAPFLDGTRRNQSSSVYSCFHSSSIMVSYIFALLEWVGMGLVPPKESYDVRDTCVGKSHSS